MNKYAILTAGLLASALSLSVLAVPNNFDRPQQPSFNAIDLDGDEMITEDELKAFRETRIAERSKSGRMRKGCRGADFSQVDTNSDGIWSKEEFDAHQRMRR